LTRLEDRNWSMDLKDICIQHVDQWNVGDVYLKAMGNNKRTLWYGMVCDISREVIYRTCDGERLTRAPLREEKGLDIYIDWGRSNRLSKESRDVVC